MIRRVRVVLIVLIIIMAGAVIFEMTRPYRVDNPIDDFVDEMIGRETIAETVEEEFPVYIVVPSESDSGGLLPVSEERQGYIADEMILVIPSLGLRQTVQPGTSQAALKKGPGLFESSGMPGESGANVSIAGHRTRDTFYYLDRLGKDDRIQLIYNSYIYTYVYYDRSVVLPTEWNIISKQGFDACTLITCTPIGVADRRMVVRFIFESVAEDVITTVSDA